MSKPTDLLHVLAHAGAADLANARMRAAGRERWSEEDYNAYVVEYHRIHPCPPDVLCDLCNPPPREKS